MKFINLKLFRGEYNLSQKELVRLTGLTQSIVSYIENGLQEISENQLGPLKEAFPKVDFNRYIYESERYQHTVVNPDINIEADRHFEGDWSAPTPISQIGEYKILITMERVSVAFDGTIIINRNDGSFRNIGYYQIDPLSLGNEYLIENLTTKDWFNDNVYESFKRCYRIACALVGRKPVNQVKQEIGHSEQWL